MRVVGIGDNVADCYHYLGLMFPGGQAFNFSAYCQMNGVESAYIGVFGSDDAGCHLVSVANQLGIDISHCRYAEGENGKAIIDLKNGDRVFVCSNRGGVLKGHPLTLTKEDLEYLKSFDLLHTSNNSYFDQQLVRIKDLPILKSYDFSRSWEDEKRTYEICRWIDFGFISCSGFEKADILKQLTLMHTWGCKVCVATMGEFGSIAITENEACSFQPEVVDALDTLGAGDSYAAGFLMQWLRQNDSSMHRKLEACLREGAKLAAQTCMVHGAFGYPTSL